MENEERDGEEFEMAEGGRFTVVALPIRSDPVYLVGQVRVVEVLRVLFVVD